jgi:neutral ceramidase
MDPKHVTWEWMDAAMIVSVELERRRSPNYEYEIQVLRLGEIALVGLPGEPFAAGQLAIKIGSPTWPTYVAHGTSDYAGYIAPRDAYARGGHEIRDTPAKWAKLAPGSLETLVEAAIATLKEVF